MISHARGRLFFHFIQPNQYDRGAKPLSPGERESFTRDTTWFDPVRGPQLLIRPTVLEHTDAQSNAHESNRELRMRSPPTAGIPAADAMAPPEIEATSLKSRRIDALRRSYDRAVRLLFDSL